MPTNYRVKAGDCLSSIAYEHGFLPDTIWNHANNAELKKKRKDGNVLLPGDQIYIPDIRQKEVPEPTNQVHKFRVKNVPAKLDLRILENGEPRRNQPYSLNLDGEILTGNTDGDGHIRTSIPPNASGGRLSVGSGEEKIEYKLRLGTLDPAEELIGVQKRLTNLGFDCGSVSGQMNEETKEAIGAFQASEGLKVTGEPNSETEAKLKEVHEGS